LPENLSYLFLLVCERDKTEPRQASVFVGSYTYTRGKCDEVQALVIEHYKCRGGKALIVERDLRNERTD
jgi:hypothetical protein